MVERVAQICQGTSTPVICDADTGFGGLLNVERTVKGYEAAGAAAIQIEDQVFPKKCGHTPGRRVVPIEQMVRKIEVAVGEPVLARLPHRRPHGCAHQPRSRRGAAARGGLRQGRRRHPVHREPGERGGDGQDRPAASICRCSPTWPTAGRTPILPEEAAGGARLQARDLPGDRLPRRRQGARARLRRAEGEGLERHARRPSSIPSTSSAAWSASSTCGSSTSSGRRR